MAKKTVKSRKRQAKSLAIELGVLGEAKKKRKKKDEK